MCRVTPTLSWTQCLGHLEGLGSEVPDSQEQQLEWPLSRPPSPASGWPRHLSPSWELVLICYRSNMGKSPPGGTEEALGPHSASSDTARLPLGPEAAAGHLNSS